MVVKPVFRIIEQIPCHKHEDNYLSDLKFDQNFVSGYLYLRLMSQMWKFRNLWCFWRIWGVVNQSPIIFSTGGDISRNQEKGCFFSGKIQRNSEKKCRILYVINCCLGTEFVSIFALNMHKRNCVHPVCCAATVCHQVCCRYWGHLGHFHRAIYHWKWYQIVCMRYLACTFSQMKYINMFSMYLQSGVPRHFLWSFIAVWT